MSARVLRVGDVWLLCALLWIVFALVRSRRAGQRNPALMNEAEALEREVNARGFKTNGGRRHA